MPPYIHLLALTAALAALVSACSAQTQLAQEEQRNGTHFASWNHLTYSLERGKPQTTSPRDIELSKSDRCLPDQVCQWWGEPMLIQPIQ